MSPEEFAKLPRIVGSEMEYSLHDIHHSSINLPAQFYNTPPFGLKWTLRGFLSNGARFYKDLNSIPEYATPECAGAAEAVAAELAGEEIVQAAIQRENESYHVFKHVSDAASHTRGYHENYLIQRQEQNDKLHAALCAHLSSRVIFSGAGTIRRIASSGNVQYMLGEKAWDITTLDSNGTTGKDKPLINLRDKPYGAADQWQRVHVTSGDANIAQWAMWYTFASTSAVLRLLEAEVELTGLTPRSPLHALHSFAGDLGLQKTVEVKDGRQLSALDIQEEIVELVRDNLLEETDDPELHMFVAEGQEACDDARKDPELLSDRVDWVAKHQVMMGRLERLDLSPESPEGFAEAKQIDIYYSDLNPCTGIGLMLRERGNLQAIVEGVEVTRLLTTPPMSTRAAWRGGRIAEMSRRQAREVSINWDRIESPPPDGTAVRSNPYAAA